MRANACVIFLCLQKLSVDINQLVDEWVMNSQG